MRREIIYHITSQPLTLGRPATASEYLRSLGYSRHLMTYLRHHPHTLYVNKTDAFTNHPLKAGDELRVLFSDDDVSESGLHIVPNHMKLDIVHEDEDLLVINKPPYLPVQPSLGHREWTLGNGVTAYYEEQGFSFVYRCINRLDKNTSGLVLIAKNMASAAILYDAMKRREIHREYFSIVHGRLPDSTCVIPPNPADNDQIAPAVWPAFPGIIDLPIARIPGSTIMRMVSFTGGKRAVTHFKAVLYDAETDTTALRIRLETGRTHQIRVHMAAIGHPVAGDGMYGTADDLIGRQALHSRVLEFCHPITRQKLHFECPIPEDMRSLCSSFSLQL